MNHKRKIKEPAKKGTISKEESKKAIQTVMNRNRLDTMKITIEIPDAKGNGTICNIRCPFFQQGVMTDYCRQFGIIQRVENNVGDIKFISYRHQKCIEAANDSV